MSEQMILANLQRLPDSLKNEVMDFIEFLLSKNQNSKISENEKKAT